MSYSRRDNQLRWSTAETSTGEIQSADIQTTFSPPLHLQANRDYELAMVNLET